MKIAQHNRLPPSRAMNVNDISKHYKTLNLTSSATDEEITSCYKRLAFLYHPDKNPGRVQWATEAMARINVAYTAIMSHRFKDASSASDIEEPVEPRKQPERTSYHKFADPEILTQKFISVRESAKDALYRYFQYGLYLIPLREKPSNRAIFNKTVHSLRKSYHAIRQLLLRTDDQELIEHFTVFTVMLFNFYRACECLNIIDSYNEQHEVEAFRLYKKGDDHLHQSHKEIFYDRHNRGYFKSSVAYSSILQAEKIFQATVSLFPDSSWSVEARIKLEYAESLRRYIELFFAEDEAK
jgi:curved DNA-binding protein CbpA